MSQLETDQWIQNMEDHMNNNPIVRKDITQHALQCFERGAATWWRMYQTINGWQGVTVWEEFKLTLLKSRLVSQKLKPYGNDMEKPCAYKLCGEIGHNDKEHQDEYPHKWGISKGVSRGFQGASLEIVPKGFVAAMEVQSTLLRKIREAQKDDKEIAEVKERMSKGKAKGFRKDEHDTLWFEDRVYVPNNAKIRK